MRLQILGVLLICGLSACNTNTAGIDSREQVRIFRDDYGTPHVVASSNRGVFYGYGYAVASDRLFQMEMLKRTTQGRVAEVLGADFVELDSHVRLSYDHRAVRRQLKSLPAQQLQILQAYADGFNARLKDVSADAGQLIPAEFTHYGFLPEAWTAYDVAMIFVGSIAHRYSDFNSERDNLALLQHLESRHGKEQAWRIFNGSKWLLDSGSPTTVPAGVHQDRQPLPVRPAYLDEMASVAQVTRVALDADGRFDGLTSDPQVARRHRQRLADTGLSHHPEYAAASNYWAVRDLNDAASALLNGPQFGFSTPGYVYGIGLHGGDFNAVGNTLLALPALLFAHNNHIAWGSTAGISDQSDEFALQLDPANPGRYRSGAGWKVLEHWEERILVRDSEPVTVVARRAAQGMVMRYEPGRGVAWVRARAWEGRELDTLMAWIYLSTDKSLDDAQQRIEAMATNINIYTMDRQGNLAYVHAGRYPHRVPGHDPRLPVPGDGRFDWRGMRPYTDNPTVRNPVQNYIANWNNRPSADWISSDLWTYTWGRADRGRILFNLLEQPGSPSVARVREINRVAAFADVSAPFMLPYLFAAWEVSQPSPLEREALSSLREWDRQWRVNASGYYGPPPALMEAWLRVLLQQAMRDDIGQQFFHLYASTNYPHKALGPSIPNPPGIKALLRNLDDLQAGHEPDFDFFNGEDVHAVIRRSFSAAVTELSGEFGTQVSGWRLRAQPMQWRPYNYRGVPQALPAATRSLPAYMNRGSENNLFVASGDGIVGQDSIPPGQSGFVAPDGKADAHSADQLQMFAEFRYKRIPFTLDEVEAAASTIEVLQLPYQGTSE